MGPRPAAARPRSLLQPVEPDLPLERADADVEDPGAVRAVAGGALEGLPDELPLHFLERRPFGDGRLRRRPLAPVAEGEGQLLEADRPRGGPDDDALEDVLELADVPRPGVPQEPRERLRREPTRGETVDAADLVQEQADEPGEVLAPLAQR